MGRPKKTTIIPLVLTDPYTGDDFTVQPLEGETLPAYKAFLDYCSMERPGVNHLLRRYQRDQEIIQAHKGAMDGQLYVAPSGDGAPPMATLPEKPAWIPKAPPSTNASTVWGWYHKHHWPKRSDLYRDLFSRVRRAGMVESLTGGIHQLSVAFQDVMEATAIEARKLLLSAAANQAGVIELKELALVAQRFTMILARVASPTNGDLDMSRYTPTGTATEDTVQRDHLTEAWEIMEENLRLSIGDTRSADSTTKAGDPYELEE